MTAQPQTSEIDPVDAGPGGTRVRVVVAGLVLATVVVGVSSTSVASSLPVIMAALGGSQAQYSWVIGATMLSAAATSPLWGKACERRNPRTLVLLALTLFTICSVTGGLMTSAPALIGLRVFQGAGVGGVFTTSTVIVVRIVPGRERAAYLGYLAAAMAIATTAGPVIGGAIADSPLGWRGNFFAGLPLAAVAFAVLLVGLRLPDHEPSTGARRFDVFGALVLPAGIAVALVWLSLGGTTWAWSSPGSIGMAVLAVVLLVVTVLAELRAVDPVIPIPLLRSRIVAANIAGVLIVPLVGSFGLYLNQYLQLGRGLSATGASLHALPLVLATAVASWLSGTMVSRRGHLRWWLLGGSCLFLLGALGLSIAAHGHPLLLISAAAAVIGLGSGITQQNFLVAAGTAVSAAQSTPLSSLGTTSRMLGSAAGIPGLGALFSAELRADAAGRPALDGLDVSVVPVLADLPEGVRTALMTSYQHAFSGTLTWCLPLLVVLVAVAVFAPPRRLDGAAPLVDDVTPTKHTTA